LPHAGPYLHSIEVSKLADCKSAIAHDATTFGVGCTTARLDFVELVAEHSTDVARLKHDAGGAAVLVISNATLLTMRTGTPADLIHGGVLVLRDGVIEGVFGGDEARVALAAVPRGAAIIDAMGGALQCGGPWYEG
jgi:hypothetical protein